MEFINVTEFYETVICMALPLLLIQRLILYCCDISTKYEQFRAKYYEAEFKFTMQYQFAPAVQLQKPKEQTVKDQMLEKEQEKPDAQRSSYPQLQEKKTESQDKQKQRQSIMEMDLEGDKQFKKNTRRPSSVTQKKQETPKSEKSNKSNKSDKSAESLDEETPNPKDNKEDEEVKSQKSQKSHKSAKKEKGEQNEGQQLNKESEKKQVQNDTQNAKKNRKSQRNSAEISSVDVQESMMQNKGEQRPRKSAQNIQQRRQTQLNKSNLAIQKNQQQQKQKEVQIELTPQELQQKTITERRRIKYCRRIDEAFNVYVPIILSIIVLGILTRSIYIFSMCCFFGFAFTSLLFNYAHLLDKLQGNQDKESIFAKVNQLFSSMFIMALLISYWIDDQFGN